MTLPRKVAPQVRDSVGASILQALLEMGSMRWMDRMVLAWLLELGQILTNLVKTECALEWNWAAQQLEVGREAPWLTNMNFY